MIGATPAEWELFLPVARRDVLPVVCDHTIPMHERTALKKAGKVPTRLAGGRFVVGIPRWPTVEATDADIAAWRKDEAFGFCIVTGRNHGVFAIDIDVTDYDLAAAIVDIVKLYIPFSRRSRSNSSKTLLAFRIENHGGALSKRAFRTTQGIVEFLATGEQFVACGTHESGARYDWTETDSLLPGVNISAVEACWAELVAQFAVAAEKTKSASSPLDPLVGNEVVTALQENGYILNHATERGRLDIICPWVDEHTTESSVSGTSLFLAGYGGYLQDAFVCKHAHCEGRNISDLREALGLVPGFEDLGAEDDEEEQESTGGEQTEREVPKLRFLPKRFHEELDDDPNGAWLVDGILPRGEVGLLLGKSSAGKSFVTIDLAVSVALGMDWRGGTVKVDQGRVLYICAEGARGWKKRRRALVKRTGLNASEIDIDWLDRAPNLMKREDAEALNGTLQACGPYALVIIDTLSASVRGGDENSGEAMGTMLHTCKSLANKHSLTILLVHHVGKDETRGARGWSGLEGNVDFHLTLQSEKNGPKALIIGKEKDSATDIGPFKFNLDVVKLGEDRKGFPVSSCVVRHLIDPWDEPDYPCDLVIMAGLLESIKK